MGWGIGRLYSRRTGGVGEQPGNETARIFIGTELSSLRKPMYTVLLALDSNKERSQRCINTLLNLPRSPSDLSVRILNVFPKIEVIDDSVYRSRDHYDDTDFPESVIGAAKTLEKEGVETEIQRKHGDPADEILVVAQEIEADCIAMGGRKRSPTGKIIFGSVTQSVLLSSDRPVLLTMSDDI